MNFDGLLAALESLLGGVFKIHKTDVGNLYYPDEHRTLKTANGCVTIYGTSRIRFVGIGNYHDNMDFLDSFEDVYDFVVRNMYDHKIKFDAKVELLRAAAETLREMAQMDATFVENFDTISPTISVLSGDVVLFRLIPKFRTIFAQFIDDDHFDDVGNAEYNGFDMRVSNIAEHGRRIPSGFHVFMQQPGNEALYGLRAFLTPGCVITPRTVTIKKVIQEKTPSPCAFYDKLLGEETVKVIEYNVP